MQLPTSQPVRPEQVSALGDAGSSTSKYCLAFPLGKWWGIRLKISALYFVFWGGFGLVGQYYTSWENALSFTVVFGPLLIMTIIIHELGHAITANKLGGYASDILIIPLGGVTLLDHNEGPRTDFWIIIAGPLTHIAQGLFWLAQAPFARIVADCNSLEIYPSQCDEDFLQKFWYKIVFLAVLINIVLLVTNLLIPVYPLDGGRALLDALLAFGMTPRTAAIASVCLSVPLALVMAVIAAVYLDDWVSFSVALLLIIPNIVMIYLIVKDKLHIHPSFRNLKITREEMDTPLIPGTEITSTGTHAPEGNEMRSHQV